MYKCTLEVVSVNLSVCKCLNGDLSWLSAFVHGGIHGWGTTFGTKDLRT